MPRSASVIAVNFAVSSLPFCLQKFEAEAPQGVACNPMPYIDFKQLVQLEPLCTPEDKPDLCWNSIARSHSGRVRDVNEDAFYHSTEQGIWAVADGMGGLARGDYASGVVAEAFVHFNKLSTLALNIRDLETRLRDAHHKCRNSFPGEPVGSTVAALFSYGAYVFFLWAGDSRVYRLRQDQLEQMTQDHTLAQEQNATHPSADLLTRAVGVHQTLHLDLDYSVVEPGDRYLICSDGLHKELSSQQLQQALSQTPARQALDNLVEGALGNGGHDNITALIVDAL